LTRLIDADTLLTVIKGMKSDRETEYDFAYNTALRLVETAINSMLTNEAS
jgi:hypothetical protein